MKKKSLDNSTYATSPGGVTISDEKLKILRPDLYGIKALGRAIVDYVIVGYSEKKSIKEHIFYGDSQPAIVISKKPLLVAAYSEDIDCVVILKFPDKFSETYKLEQGSRLLTVNTYLYIEDYQKDLMPGPNNDNTWCGVSPIIVDFISDDIDTIESKKNQFEESLWSYVYNLGVAYSKTHPNVCRDGRPVHSSNSAI